MEFDEPSVFFFEAFDFFFSKSLFARYLDDRKNETAQQDRNDDIDGLEKDVVRFEEPDADGYRRHSKRK